MILLIWLKRLSFFVFLVSFPFFTFADSYFEYNPDYYNISVINVISSDTPSEVFVAQNDFLSGFDLWLDNDGSSGPARFELVADDTVLISRTLTIPHIAKTTGGQRFNVSFGQLAVSNDKLYSIRVISDLPYLRLFYGNSVSYIPHNAPYLSEYSSGTAYLGNEKKGYSFKFALHENVETKSPILGNITIRPVSENQVRINFNADEPVDYKIFYGLHGTGYNRQTDYFNDYKFCVESVGTCELLINVEPDSTYDFMLSAKDRWTNMSQAVGTFTTSGNIDVTPIISPTIPPDDTTPPIISNVRVITDGPRSVSFIWTTNEIASSFYLVSINPYMISIDAGSDPTFELEHFLITQPILDKDTEYTCTLSSRDISNNETTVRFVFTTSGIQETPTPSPTITVTPTTSSTTSPTPTPLISQTPTPQPTISFLPSFTPIPSNEPPPPSSSTPTPSGYVPTPTPSSPNDNLPPLTIEDGSGNGDSGSIVGWSAPSGGEPSDGYRIDVFNERGDRVATQVIPAGTHEAKLDYNIGENDTTIVYGNEDGTFKKIAKATKGVSKKSFLEKLVIALPYILGGIFVVAIAIVLILKYLKKRKPPKSNISYFSDSYSSAQSGGL